MVKEVREGRRGKFSFTLLEFAPKGLRETTNVLVPIANYRRNVNRLRRVCVSGTL